MGQKHRRQYLIEPSFQIKFIVKFCVVVIIGSLLIGGSVFFLTRNSTTVAIENTKVLVKPTSDFILPSLLIAILIVSAFTAFGVLILSLHTSHKIAGPIFRLRKEIYLMQKGDMTQDFSIRDKDQLQILAYSLSCMTSTFCAKHKALKDAYQDLVCYLKERDFCVSSNDKDELSKKLDDMNNAFSYFKVK